MASVRSLRDRLEAGIRSLIPEARLNGHPDDRLPNTVNMTLPDMRGESMVLALDQQGVSISSGSACRSGSPAPSHVLMALGLTEEEAHCALRLSLGVENTDAEIDSTLSYISEIIKSSKESVRFVPCR